MGLNMRVAMGTTAGLGPRPSYDQIQMENTAHTDFFLIFQKYAQIMPVINHTGAQVFRVASN